MDVFCFELSKLFVNSGATDIVLVTLSSTVVERAIAQCTSRWAMARGHRLNTSIVLAAVHGLSGLFRAVSMVEPSLCRPLPTLSPSLISLMFSVDVKHHVHFIFAGPSAQKRSSAGRWSWAAKVGLLSLRVVPQQRCNGHCPCDSAQHGS